MTRTVYYTAATLDGFIADEQDSLAWLFEQHDDPDRPSHYDEFIADVGALAMGATTYDWITSDVRRTGGRWPYEQPTWVFTHRPLQPVVADVSIVEGAVADHLEAIRAAAAGRDVWVVGGGDLAGQFAEAGSLDRVVVSIAPVTLGAGRPLFPRRHDLRLAGVERNGDFVVATYDVVGPRAD